MVDRPLLTIGLDAAEPELIRSWAEAGELPTIAGLMRSGPSWTVLSPAWMSTGPVWPCFYAGTSPARHGRFFYRQLESGSYRIVKKQANEINARPFWEDLTKDGAKIAIIDVPKTVPHKYAATAQICGWGVHSAAWRPSSFPDELFDEVVRSIGTHPVPNCDEVTLESADNFKEFLDALTEGIRRKEALARKLLSEDRWDLFLLVFSEAHCAGHCLWHLHDRNHPDHDRELRKMLGDPLLRVYRQIDDAVGNLIQAAGESAVILFSPHGMGPNFGASHLLPEVLERLDLGPVSTRNGGRQHNSNGDRTGLRALRDKAIGAVPERFVRAVRNVMPARLWDAMTTRILSIGNAWPGSVAFCVPGDFAGAVRINLIGREPNGKVEPGRDYDELCQWISDALMELKIVDSERSAVREVVRVDQVYSGESLDQLPDLIVCWADDRPIPGLSSPKIGVVRGVLSESRTGEDRSDGFLSITGCPDLEKAAACAEVDLIDLAPTITDLLGGKVDGRFDGRSLLANRVNSTSFGDHE